MREVRSRDGEGTTNKGLETLKWPEWGLQVAAAEVVMGAQIREGGKNMWKGFLGISGIRKSV